MTAAPSHPPDLLAQFDQQLSELTSAQRAERERYDAIGGELARIRDGAEAHSPAEMLAEQRALRASLADRQPAIDLLQNGRREAAADCAALQLEHDLAELLPRLRKEGDRARKALKAFAAAMEPLTASREEHRGLVGAHGTLRGQRPDVPSVPSFESLTGLDGQVCAHVRALLALMLTK
jgi:hypothetical protein